MFWTENGDLFLFDRNERFIRNYLLVIRHLLARISPKSADWQLTIVLIIKIRRFGSCRGIPTNQSRHKARIQDSFAEAKLTLLILYCSDHIFSQGMC